RPTISPVERDAIFPEGIKKSNFSLKDMVVLFLSILILSPFCFTLPRILSSHSNVSLLRTAPDNILPIMDIIVSAVSLPYCWRNMGSSWTPSTTADKLERACARRISILWMYTLGASSTIRPTGRFPLVFINLVTLFNMVDKHAEFILCVLGSLASTSMPGDLGDDIFRLKSSPEKTQNVSLVAMREINILSVPTCPSSWSNAFAL